jgi:hypothetical protein
MLRLIYFIVGLVCKRMTGSVFLVKQTILGHHTFPSFQHHDLIIGLMRFFFC